MKIDNDPEVRKEKFIWIAGSVMANVAFLASFKAIFFLTKFSNLLPSRLKEIYPRFSEIIYWLIQKANPLFELWFILFLLVNGLFIYLIAKQYNKIKELTLVVIALILSLATGEFLLRKFNYTPGIHTRVRYFHAVDSLYLLKGFEADSLGIFKISSVARNEIAAKIKLKDQTRNDTQAYEVYSLGTDYEELISGKIDNEFSKFYAALKNKSSVTLTELEKEVLTYVDSPINTDGFRSIAFKNYQAEKPKILLLGDSFTWGHSTTTISNSFADILLAKGYVVYNTGITATDVSQYLAVALKYIPALKPDVVIINFYLGNDITYYKREVKPYAPVFYATNAGNLMACPHGEYFKNPQEAYNLTLRQWQIPEEDNIVNRLMAKTAITTLLWKVLMKLEIVHYGISSDVGYYYYKAEKRKFAKPYCNEELKAIKKIADENGAGFILSSLPEVYSYTHKTKEDFPDLFEGLDYVEMAVEKSDYKLDDGHFNDAGHKKYAAFLDSLISNYE